MDFLSLQNLSMPLKKISEQNNTEPIVNFTRFTFFVDYGAKSNEAAPIRFGRNTGKFVLFSV